MIIDLGSVMVPKGGSSAPLDFELPTGTRSFMLVLEGPAGHDGWLVCWLRNPSGELLVNESNAVSASAAEVRAISDVAQWFSVNRSSAAYLGGGQGVLAVPNNDNADVARTIIPGRWSFKVKQSASFVDEQESRVRGRLIAKIGPSDATRGRLRVYLHFTGSEGLSAAAVRSNLFFRSEIERAKAFFRRHGIELAIDLAASQDTPPGLERVEIGGGSDSTHLRLIESGRAQDGINVYFADTIWLRGVGNGLAGMSPLPLIPFSPASPNGSVLLSNTGGRGFASTLVHELGHALGLPHIVETWDHTARRADQISDTSPDQRDNFMYDGGPRCGLEEAKATPGQVTVMLNHPLVELIRE